MALKDISFSLNVAQQSGGASEPDENSVTSSDPGRGGSRKAARTQGEKAGGDSSLLLGARSNENKYQPQG